MINKLLILLALSGAATANAQRILKADEIDSNTGAGSMCVNPTVVLSCSEMSYLDGVTSPIQTQLNSKAPTGSYVTALTGDVTATGPGSSAATVAFVGGSTAAAVNTATVAVGNATAAATSNTMCLRDGFASSSFGAVTATTLTGNLSNTSTVDTVPVATVLSGVAAANAATASATSNTIAKRDGFGQLAATGFYGGDLNGNVTGTAANVTGVVQEAHGGSGQSNFQASINNLTSITSHSNGDVFQLISGNAQFAPLTYSPSGTPSAMTYFDATTGALTDLPGWNVATPFTGLYGSRTWNAPADGGGTQYPRTLSSFVDVESAQDTTEFIPELGQLEMQIDNANTGKNFQSAYGLLLIKSHAGTGTIGYQSNLDVTDGFGNGTNAGTTTDANTVNIYANVAANYTIANNWSLINGNATVTGVVTNGVLNNLFLAGTGSIANNFTSQNLGMQVAVTNDLTMMNINNNHPVGNNYNGLFVNSDSTIGANATMIGSNNTNTVAQNLTMYNAYNSAIATVGADYRAAQFGNDATVANNAAAVLTNQNGNVAGSYTGFGAYVTGDVGTTGNGNNVFYFDGGDQGASTKTIHGNLFGLNLSNVHSVPDTNTNIQFINANNQGAGYRFTGLGVYNSGNMTEEIKGADFNLQGNARTGVILNATLNGAYTDDVHGLRVDVSNATSTSTSSHVMAAEISGGNVSINGQMTPFNGANIDIGNYFSNTSQIASGSPVTGTDIIQQIFQSNLILHDTIAPGPFGLGVNATAIVPQIALDSGIVLPYHRTLLLGTSVPSGSGGTITDGVDAELLGYASFGGSLSVTNLVGLQDSQILGQQFCDYATNCWFLRVRDARAETSLPKLAINTSSQKVSTNVRLEINDGHVRSTQTTAPTTAVDANAGTSATCVVANATDTAGRITLTTGTGTTAAGAQCVVTFNLAHNVAPVCVVTPANDAAASTSGGYLGNDGVGGYGDESTTTLTLRFAGAGDLSTEYKFKYHCVETN